MAAEIYTDFPQQINASEKYIIYSHGKIVEGDDPMPVHERFGVYDFPAIKKALFDNGKSNLIAHHRPANTDVNDYVEKLVSWVDTLLKAGVKPADITLIGFSKGGHMTALASAKLKAKGINTVIMAACWKRGVLSDPSVTLGGHFLSIYETSDMALSCKVLAQRSDQLLSFEEIALSTGKGHGAFFNPMAEWVEPLVRWLKQKVN